MSGLDDIDGKELMTPNGPVTVHLLPKEVIEFNIEIVRNHPELHKLLQENLSEDNYSPEHFFGTVAAYCGIVLDSTNSPGNAGYSVAELYEQLGRALVNKRENMAVSVNTIPTVQALTGMLSEMKEEHDKQEAAKKEITLDSNIAKLN